MINSLLHLFDSLETQRNELLSITRHLSREQFNAHPEGKWSIARIMSHLIASEQLSVSYLNKKMQGIKEAPDTGFKEAFTMMMLVISQRLPLKFKAPNVLAENTHLYETSEQLTEAWEKVRKELKQTLTRFEDDQLKRKVFRHPIAGMLNIKQTLRFFNEHISHHTPQIIHLLRKK